MNQIYPPVLQVNKTNILMSKLNSLYLHVFILNGYVSSKIYDQRDEFDFDIVKSALLNGNVSHATCYGVYIYPVI